MNHPFNETELGRRIDRLVDGELSDPDRRALLARLDDAPDGWRRCALAFLESREWRGAVEPAPSASKIASMPKRQKASATRALAMAASVASAFFLGWASRRPLPVEAPVAPLVVAEAPTALPPPTVAKDAPKTPVEDWLALDGRSPSGPSGSSAPWTWPGEPPAARVPELPSSVVEDWRRQGYEVESRPRLVSVNGEGGRDAPLPVNEVRVRYVGDRTY